MVEDLNNNDTFNIKNFLVNEVQAKYYKDLIKKEKTRYTKL